MHNVCYSSHAASLVTTRRYCCPCERTRPWRGEATLSLNLTTSAPGASVHPPPAGPPWGFPQAHSARHRGPVDRSGSCPCVWRSPSSLGKVEGNVLQPPVQACALGFGAGSPLGPAAPARPEGLTFPVSGWPHYAPFLSGCHFCWFRDSTSFVYLPLLFLLWRRRWGD